MYPTAAGGAGALTAIFSEPKSMNIHAQRALSRLSPRSGSPEHKSSTAGIDMLPARGERRAEHGTSLESVLSELYFKLLAQEGDLKKIMDLCGKKTFLPTVLEEGAKTAQSHGHAKVQAYILSLLKAPGLAGIVRLSSEERPSFFEPLK